MTTETNMLLVITISLITVLGVHALLSRGLPGSPRQIVAIRAVLIGYLPLLILLRGFVLSQVAPQQRSVILLYSVITYSGFGYFYFHLFNTSETARRIKMIYQIYTSESLNERDISTLYNTTEIVKLRLKRLTETHQLNYENGYYSVKGRLLYVGALIVALWQHVLGLDRFEVCVKENEQGGIDAIS